MDLPPPTLWRGEENLSSGIGAIPAFFTGKGPRYPRKSGITVPRGLLCCGRMQSQCLRCRPSAVLLPLRPKGRRQHSPSGIGAISAFPTGKGHVSPSNPGRMYAVAFWAAGGCKAGVCAAHRPRCRPPLLKRQGLVIWCLGERSRSIHRATKGSVVDTPVADPSRICVHIRRNDILFFFFITFKPRVE